MTTDEPDFRKRITIDPNILVGKPVVTGTRIPVSLILNLLAHGYDSFRIKQAYPNLTDDSIKAALTYAEARLDREEVCSLVD